MSSDAIREWPPKIGADGEPLAGTSVDMLDMQRVQQHIEQAIMVKRHPGTTDPMEYLLKRRCLIPLDGEYRATMTGLLCFGKDPQAIFHRAVTDLGHYRGVEPLTYEVVDLRKSIGGTILEQMTAVLNYLMEHTVSGQSLKGGLQAVPGLQYPEYVLRELSVNMLAHRDYTEPFSTPRVLLFRNRIEWYNPGGLDPDFNIQDLLRKHKPRNPYLLQVLYDIAVVEAFGHGLYTVSAELERHGMKSPEFHIDKESFTVIVYGKPLEIIGEGTWEGLSETQRAILSVLYEKGEASIGEVFTALEGKRARRTLQREVAELVDLRLVDEIGKGRGTRYRIHDDILA